MDNNKRRAQTVILDDVQILWPNFTGRATDYNSQGSRNFYAILSEEQAQRVMAVGGNVKVPDLTPEQIEAGYSASPRIKINVKFQEDPNKSYLNPSIMMVTQGRGTDLTESTVGILDGLRFSRVKIGITVSPYEWGKRSGYTIYLNNMLAFVREDEWEQEYAQYRAQPCVATSYSSEGPRTDFDTMEDDVKF